MRPQAIGATGGDDRFYAPGYQPLVESPGFMAPGPPQIAAQNPVAIANTPVASSRFDLSSITSIFSGMETWQIIVLAGAIYYFFFRKGRH